MPGSVWRVDTLTGRREPCGGTDVSLVCLTSGTAHMCVKNLCMYMDMLRGHAHAHAHAHAHVNCTWTWAWARACACTYTCTCPQLHMCMHMDTRGGFAKGSVEDFFACIVASEDDDRRAFERCTWTTLQHARRSHHRESSLLEYPVENLDRAQVMSASPRYRGQ
jgi:hypothetical protein